MSDFFELSNDIEVASHRGNFDRSVVEEVWNSAEVITGNDSALWRKDEHGSRICRSEYGNRGSSFGWEIVEGGSYLGGNPGELKALHIDNF